MTVRLPSSRQHARGFTLVEMIASILIMGVVAGSLVVFMRPAIETTGNVRARAELTDEADNAVRAMIRDVQRAVPNSIRTPSSDTSCFELIPATGGGRYRMAADTVNDTPVGCSTPSSTCSAPLDTTRVTSTFDTLTTLSSTPAVGDWVVVNNQNGNDVYDGLNRAAITGFNAAPLATQGVHRIDISPTQFSVGYAGGRFQVVPNSQQAVFYVCSGVGSSGGNGTGKLYRLKAYGFNSSYPTACPSGASSELMASRLSSCKFLYDPNQGATQQSGYISIEIDIMRNNETVHLSAGAHVSNVP